MKPFPFNLNVTRSLCYLYIQIFLLFTGNTTLIARQRNEYPEYNNSIRCNSPCDECYAALQDFENEEFF